MPVLGRVKIADFLERTGGAVRGRLLTDAKVRTYSADYIWSEDGHGNLTVNRADGNGDSVTVPPILDLDESILAFWGLYSGDGAKGSEDPENPGTVKPVISFSQREPNLVRFMSAEFRRLFPGGIRLTFSLGEDSAYFMDGTGLDMLRKHYGGQIPPTPRLSEVRPIINDADRRYLGERRSVPGSNEEHLAFYYFHKAAMQEILTEIKISDLESGNVDLAASDKVTASLRRPFKKGAREPGGTSRSDEMHVGGLNGFGELFLKILHEIEQTLHEDSKVSAQGLVEWPRIPSQIGEALDVRDFFLSHNYGVLAGERPVFRQEGNQLFGKWPRSGEVQLRPVMRVDPLFCYVSGLYLAEGNTPKSRLFAMFTERVRGLRLGFTSSEGVSLDIVLRSLGQLFRTEDCLDAWKIKVGSQYFPELVVIGLKNGVPMLRGGNSGDGKMRTMEISLALREWALEVAPALLPFKDRYSHVEPTGAGLARVDFWASSSLCKWYFPLLMYAAFGGHVSEPVGAFTGE